MEANGAGRREKGLGHANLCDLSRKAKYPTSAFYPFDDGFINTAPVNRPNAKPNLWGLFDMIGNVRERCSDYYEPYPKEEVADPSTPPAPDRTYVVYRGGDFNMGQAFSRSATRGRTLPNSRDSASGFRVVMEAQQPSAKNSSSFTAGRKGGAS